MISVELVWTAHILIWFKVEDMSPYGEWIDLANTLIGFNESSGMVLSIDTIGKFAVWILA